MRAGLLRSRRNRVWIVCVGTAVPIIVSGCVTTIAQSNLDRLTQYAQGQPLLVRSADFRDVDPSSVDALENVKSTTAGSAVLREALRIDPGLREYVASHGLPDDVMLLQHSKLQLIYVETREVVVVMLDRSPDLDVVSTRALTDTERTFVDPDVRRRLGMARLRAVVAGADRVWRIFWRLRAVTPNLPKPIPADDMVVVPATEVSRGVFHLPDDAKGIVVAWVPPGTAAANLVESGDLVTHVDGYSLVDGPPPSAADEASASSTRMTIVRGGVTLEVVVPCEPRPPVSLVVYHSAEPNAAAMDGALLLSTGMTDLAADDDLLAAVLAHELAHIAAGHLRPNIGARLLTVPIEVILPGIGHAAVTVAATPFRRDDEREADRMAIDIARRAGFDPAGLVRVLELLAATPGAAGSGGFLASHPSFPERIAAARSGVGAPPP